MDWTAWLVIATLLLVVVTVFKDKIDSWLFRPRLTAAISRDDIWPYYPPSSDEVVRSDTPSPPPPPTQRKAYFIRMRITNVEYRRSAQGHAIEVFASALNSVGIGGSDDPRHDFVGFNLKWAWGDDIIHTDILPGVGKYVDIGTLFHPDHRRSISYRTPNLDAWNRPLLALAAFPQPIDDCSFLEPGGYRLELLIGGANAPVQNYTLSIEFSNDWSDDDQATRKLIKLSLSPAPR
jgi:hypothetical protein